MSWAGERIIEHTGTSKAQTRPTTLSAYGNGHNHRSSHVVIWIHEKPHGVEGESAAMSLTPEQAIQFAHELIDLANDVLMEADL